ncbi:MAG: energy transducer TonB [Xanthomonadaceae bacterium]|jgi:protein TonB|nr:energy transducer TonB [Xanthomonadaceae bacterium]
MTLLAFAIGLLLFMLVWQKDRSRTASELATIAPVAADPVLPPLPEPRPADSDGASDMQPAAEDPQPVQWSEVPSAPAATPETPSPETPPLAPPVEIITPPQSSPPSVSQPLPLPEQSPAPEYPARALRRGEGGTVRVQVEVDIDGKPRRVNVIERSGSRQLDRAAVEAVRRWRFQPARHDGQPVPGTAVIPIDFNPQTGAGSRQR